jgi:2-hydroxy-3-oxopropionate reductase
MVMTTVAFVGLGIMGAPMARNLRAAGFDVVAYNRSPAKVEQFVSDGGRGAGSVADAVREADAVVTLVVDMSTIRPDVTRRIAEAAAARELSFLDAPVSGGEQGAIDGKLSIMVGGEAAAFESARPILDALGTTVVHVGGSGSGQTVKAANQLVVAGVIELVSEALTFLDAYDVDLESAVRVLAGGLAGNAVLDRKAPGMLARNFQPGFRVDLHHKDLGIFGDAARQAGTATPLGAVVAGLVASLRAQGMGDLDHSALLLQVERLSGRER